MLHTLILRLLALCLCASTVLAQSGGSTFVLNRFGQHVQGNSFSRNDGVYISGGPASTCLAPGLVDGDYYFQITDPAGTVLLTTDSIQERRVRVAGGIFAKYLGGTRVSAPVGPCGALNVRLAPFTTSPYPIREYKVWLTRVEDYDPLGSHVFGFDPARSKSDNFRVGTAGPQSILRGHKFFDHDGNGIWNPSVDPLEVPVGGWRVEIRRNGVLDGVTFTDQDGWYLFVRDRDPGTWDISEVSPNGFVNDGTAGATWLATTPRSGTVVATTEYVAGPEFGNVSYAVSVGAGRSVSFWSDDDHGPGGPSGRPILEGCDPTWREALNARNGAPVNLRTPVSNDNPSASIFTLNMPPQSFNGAFANWKSYANRTSHDHAGFMLSREVAATILSNSCGFMQGDILIDRFQDGILVPLDAMLAGAIGLLSEVGAGLTGPDDPYQDLRARMLGCINEFRSINDTGDPSAPQVVFTRESMPGSTGAPY